MAWYSQRSDFQIVEFYRAIQKYGQVVVWEKSARCPCIPKEGQGQPDFNCILCHGKGWYWFDPQTIRGIMTNFNENMRYNQTGEIITGISYFTTLPEYKLAPWDRVTNFHSKIRYGEVKTKGEKGKKDKLRFKPIEMVNLRTLNRKYDDKIDYIVDTDGFVDWVPTGYEPVVGERYSIEYIMHPSWIIIDMTNVIRDTYVKSKKPGVTHQELPQRATIKLEFFVWES